MTTRLQEDGEFYFFGTLEENSLMFHDKSANVLIIQSNPAGTLRDMLVLDGGNNEVRIQADNVPLVFGSDQNVEIDFSTADTSNPSFVIALDDTSQQMHITDNNARDTDWALSANTDPELYIHSNTTPTTDYIRIGNHTGTLADIDVVGGTTLQLMIAGTLEAALTATDFDLQSNTLSNIAAAGNDWTANLLYAVNTSNGGDDNQVRITNSSNTSGSNARLRLDVGGTSSGDPQVQFDTGSGGATLTMGMDNSDSGDRFAIGNHAALGSSDQLLMVIATGVLSVNGDGGGSDDPVSLFDAYDDALELQKFAYSHPAATNFGITIEQREANRFRMVEMGVAEWTPREEGPDVLMYRIQPLLRLLAGGIYQTRQVLDGVVQELAETKRELALVGGR